MTDRPEVGETTGLTFESMLGAIAKAQLADKRDKVRRTINGLASDIVAKPIDDMKSNNLLDVLSEYVLEYLLAMETPREELQGDHPEGQH